MEIINLTIIFLASIFAGLYGALIGGGGLLTTPLLILLGLSPHTAIGTTKFGNIGGNSVSTYNFSKHKLINYKLALITTISIIIGTIIGSTLIIRLNEETVKRIISVFIITMLIIMILKNNIGIKNVKKTINKKTWITGSISMLIIGIYAGLFGGGFGTLMSYALIFIFGQSFLESAGTRKIPGLASNIIGFVIFWMNGLVNFKYGIIMLIGISLGAYISSHYAPKIGDVWIRRGFIFIAFILAIKLLMG